LELLVHKISNMTVSGEPQIFCNGADQIILDKYVDGVRCLLTRKAKKPGKIKIVISPRERTIARMVADGYPNKVIALNLRISTWTVSTHLRRVFAKLGVGSRAAMVAHLMESGILAGSVVEAPDPNNRDVSKWTET
jgi:DNA-binding CsgD family transcriptional regulator